MINFYTKVGDRIIDIDPGFFQFSAGEWHFNAKDRHFVGNEIAWVDGKVDVNDYIKLKMWHDVVDHQGGKATIFIPYLPAARADKGIPRGANIYASLLSGLTNAKIYTVDAHSDYMVDVLLERINIANLTWEDLPKSVTDGVFINTPYDGIIAPDEGAVERAEIMANDLGGLPVYVAKKERELSTGRILSYQAPDFKGDIIDRLLVPDDICDGGRTFIELARAIHNKKERIKLDLYVTHGIFSNGLSDLLSSYDTIMTLNLMGDVALYSYGRNKVFQILYKTELMKEYA